MNNISLYIPNIFVLEGETDMNTFLEKYDDENNLFIITPSIRNQLQFVPRIGSFSEGYSLSQEVLDAEILKLKEIKKIIVVGASKIVDQSKYIAAKLNIPLVVIPSLISTNAFSTGRSALKVNNIVVSLESKTPEEVYIIYSLLEKAPREYNMYGLIDVLSIYTALHDWRIAINDNKAHTALEYYLAEGILDSFLSINPEKEGNYYNITKLLLHSGLVVSMYGDGRPESGSEHIVAKAVESKIECFHAYSVSFGMLIIMKLQDSWKEDMATIVKNIPNWRSDYGKNILNQIENLISSKDIKPREGRYTILDKVDSEGIDKAIKEVIEYLENDLHM